MKKLFVSCMIAFMAICSVGAQEVYIGGGFTVGSESKVELVRIDKPGVYWRWFYSR